MLYRGKKLNGAAALAEIGWQPLVLEAKEGLSLINGTACSTGIACVALDRANRLAGWADAAASMTYENLGNQAGTFEMETLSMRQSWGLQEVGARLRFYLNGSPILAEMAGRRTQDPLSLRAIPQIHGAVVDQLEDIGRVINRELSSITDNPAVTGTPTRLWYTRRLTRLALPWRCPWTDFRPPRQCSERFPSEGSTG